MKSMPYVLRWISLTAITLVMVLCINRSNYDPKTNPEGQISKSPNMPDEGDLITSFSIIAYTKPNVKTIIYHLWPDIYDRRDAQFVLSKGL